MKLHAAWPALFAFCSPATAGDPPPPPPNIVIVLVDDLGTDHLRIYHELNPYKTDRTAPPIQNHLGSGDPPFARKIYPQIPNLIEFARAGVRFDNAYAHPTCSVSRASLLTGNYPIHHGVGGVINEDSQGNGLVQFGDPDFDSTTLAELVQQFDYDDRIVGKWHLGKPTDDLTICTSERGWCSIRTRGGWSSWNCIFSGVLHNPEPEPPPQPPNGCAEAEHPDTTTEGTYYNFVMGSNTQEEYPVVCDYEASFLFEDALEWCNAHAGEPTPFLCLISLNTVHSPYHWGPPSDLIYSTDTYDPPGIVDLENAFIAYASMIEAIDFELGQFYEGLHPDVLENTLFLFLSDNGGPPTSLDHARQSGTTCNPAEAEEPFDVGEVYDFLLDADGGPSYPSTPYFKGLVLEKGVRIPMIAWGAGVVGNPTTPRSSKALVQIEDVYATIADILSAPFTSIDGRSFLSILKDTPGPDPQAREIIWTQKFSPLGYGIGGVHFNEQIGCSKRFPGGRFKLIRRWESSIQRTDLLFRLEDDQGALWDPWETYRLDLTTYASEYTQLLAEVNAVLATAPIPPP